MDLRRIRYFLSLAEYLNFRKAAENLHISQSALSEQIAALEADLEVKLFERSSRAVRLTPGGAEYLPGAQQLIADFDACAHRAREAQAGRRGSLRIGTSGWALIDHLPEAARVFRSAYPEISLDIVVVRESRPLEMLRSGAIDLMVAAEVSEPGDGIAGCFLWMSTQRVVLPRDHPLAGRDTIHLHELQTDMLLTPARREGRGAYASVLALCREQGFTPSSMRSVPEVAEVETLFGLVGCGIGYTIMAAPFERMAPPNVVFKQVSGAQRTLRLWGYWESTLQRSVIDNFLSAACDA
jgi:DNA-binding transcriptional LysR family regulator